MKAKGIAIGDGWVLYSGTRFPFRKAATQEKANFDCRPESVKAAFPVIRSVNIFVAGGYEYRPAKAND